ncbi:EAL domain-containing protein [Vreelandella venusta]
MIGRSLGEISRRQARELKVSEQRFRSLYDHHPDAVFSFDRNGFYQSMNPATEHIVGIREEEAVGVSFRELFNSETVPGADLQTVYRAYEEANRGYPRTDFQMTFRPKGKVERIFDVTFLPIVVDGEIDGVFGLAKDVSERMKIEEKQRIMERSLEASSNAIVITDARLPGYPVVYVNPAFSQITGYIWDEIYGKALGMLTGEGTDEGDIQTIRTAVAEEKSATLTLRSYRKDGAPFWNQLFLSPVSDDSGSVTHFIAVMNDISEKKEQDQKLAYQATHDVLTGLGNRSLFNDRLSHDFELAKRQSCLMAVLFIDLDEFKPINDTLGHKVGDKLLISVAERLSSVVRPSDTLVRFGGDEFVLLLPDLQSQEDAVDVAERVLEEIARPHQVGNNELHISASIGIATISEQLEHSEKLLQQADMAMYKAKQQGRNTYEVFSCDLDSKLSRRVELRNDLQEAIKKDQLHLNYQPLVNAGGGFIGIEALVRWRHPQKGNISPADFIPIAEETGQITQLGHWVTKRACLDALSLVNQGLLPGRVAVNLSPMQFHRPNFLATLRQILEETGLPPEHLELELTEGILMRDIEGAIDTLNALSGMGVSTAIDDFGTGFSSFSYLRELPVDKIKIDKSFVDNVITNEKDSAVCKGVIAMARELDLKMIAEGVETKEQYHYLVDSGCTGFQGYYFAKPMVLDDLIKWLEGCIKRPMH